MVRLVGPSTVTSGIGQLSTDLIDHARAVLSA